MCHFRIGAHFVKQSQKYPQAGAFPTLGFFGEWLHTQKADQVTAAKNCGPGGARKIESLSKIEQVGGRNPAAVISLGFRILKKSGRRLACRVTNTATFS